MYDYNYFRCVDESYEMKPFSPMYMPYIQFIPMPSPIYMTRQHGNMPPGPPPLNAKPPETSPQLKAVDPGSIKRCLFRFVYIWPRRGRGFWAWLTHVSRRSVSGYRWHRGRWVYFGMGLNQIESFMCY